MAVALIQRRASWRTFLRWPLVAAIAMGVGIVLWPLIRNPLIPVATSRPSAWLPYLTGWLFFALLGAMAGVLVTRRMPTAAIAQFVIFAVILSIIRALRYSIGADKSRRLRC